MKNSKITEAYDAIKPDDTTRARVLRKIITSEKSSRSYTKIAISFATVAAVIGLVLLGNFIGSSKKYENTFTFRAYAVESINSDTLDLHDLNGMRDINQLSMSSGFYHNYIRGESGFRIVVQLTCDGENIQSVEYDTSYGDFARLPAAILESRGIIVQSEGNRQWLDQNNSNYVPGLWDYWDSASTDNIGNSFFQSIEETSDGIILYLYKVVETVDQIPSTLTLRATATFTDGSTQEQSFDVPLSVPDWFTDINDSPPAVPPEDTYRINTYDKLLRIIPYDECEILEGVVRPLEFGDLFTYRVSDVSDEPIFGSGGFAITPESMETAELEGYFDDNGIFWVSSNLYDLVLDYYDGVDFSDDGKVAVIKREPDGSYSGMIYVVPNDMILDCLASID